MRQGLIRKVVLILIILLLLLSIFFQNALAQSEDERIMDEIGEDWPTDVIQMYVETPNKYNLVYGTNINDKAVLDEISAVEEAMNPQRQDGGEQDDITYVMSISTLIKEINEAPRNIVDAAAEELDPVIDPPYPPGDHEYSIPQDQDEIDEIVGQIPFETLSLFVRDTNSDGIWDTALIWMGTIGYSRETLDDIDKLIDRYHVDPNAERDDFNSRHEWWTRIDSGTIHCQITNMGYATSFESHYIMQNTLVLGLILVIIFILMGLLIIMISTLNSRRKKGNEPEKMKKRIMLTLFIFSILIAANLLIGFLGNPDSISPKLDQFNNEFNGGQIGLSIIRGNQGPGPNDESRGSGSMKDIEVLDSIERLECDLENIVDPSELGHTMINSPLNIIDIMKIIKIPENLAVIIPMDLIPPELQSEMDNILNTSFWDAIHTAGQVDSLLWYYRYDKSFQDSLINIFYDSITFEMRTTFVKEDYSRSLLYLQLPLRGEDESDALKGRINNVISNHRTFLSASRLVFVDSPTSLSQNAVTAIKIIAPFGLFAAGLIVYILLLNEIHKLDEKEDKGSEEVEGEPEAIFEDITDDEHHPPYEIYPPPGFKP